MNKIRTLVRAPALTQSGYGVHSRQLIFSLLNDRIFDVYLESIPWGQCGYLVHDTPEKKALQKLSEKYIVAKAQNQEDWDLFISITIPQEWDRRGKYNVGVTAGIETDRVSHEWILKANEMDLIIVPSEHSKASFVNPVYEVHNQQTGQGFQLRLEKPIVVCPEGVDTSIFTKLTQDQFQSQSVISSLKFDTDFNFLVVGQWGNGGFGEDRKNIANTIRYFIETFYGRKDVGLVLKVNMGKNTAEDESKVISRINQIKTNYDPKNTPPIYLVHGVFSDEEMVALYNHPQIKVMLSLTAGEGWGLPLLEAAACELPIIVTNWSGHLDFLKNGLFIPLKYELKEIPEASVWEPVLIKGSRWAVVDVEDVKQRLEKIVKSYFKPTEWAKELKQHVGVNFNLARVQNHFLDVLKKFFISSVQTELNPQEYLESLLDEGDYFNVLFTLPFHAGDVFIGTAVIDGLVKKLPKNSRIYFATDPKYYDILKGNKNVYKCIPWNQTMMNIELCESVFDHVFTPNIATQFTFSNWVRGGNGRLLAEEYANHCQCELGDYFIQEETFLKDDIGPYMTFHPSSGKDRHEARKYVDWKEVLTNVKAVCPDLKIVQVGEADEPKFDEVDVDFRGKTNINQLASVMKNSLLHLGVDSLQVHMAAAFNVPVVAIYGSSYASSTGPWVKDKQNYKYVLLEPSQRLGNCQKACYKYSCRENKEMSCVNSIDSFEIFQSVFQLLKTYE